MGNGLVISGLSTGFDLAASNFDIDTTTYMKFGRSVEKASAALPASTVGNLFTITGGRIMLTAIVGEVTVVIQTQANNTKLVFDPTVAGSNVDLCAVTDITGDTVGHLYTITGTAGDALVTALAVKAMVTPVILQPGAIALSCAATNTGEAKWKMWYMPLDSGVTVAAA